MTRGNGARQMQCYDRKAMGKNKILYRLKLKLDTERITAYIFNLL